jgi:hypothetical protein
MSVAKEPLRVGVLGMDDKARAMLEMFLQGPCKNRAVLTEESSAQVSIVDMDGLHAKNFLAEEKQRQPRRPIILLSLAAQEELGTIYVRKPVQAERMTLALEEARRVLVNGSGKYHAGRTSAGARQQGTKSRTFSEKRLISRPPAKKAAHRSVMLLDETSYSALIGSAPDIDPRDPRQVQSAYYDPREFLQAYVQSAVNLALSKKRILRLNTGWKPILIFPHSREVWVDADDKQLRAFCMVPIKTISSVDVTGSGASGISVTPVSMMPGEAGDPAKLQSVDAFLWKLAIWTSAGKVPRGTDLKRPVYLERWPNMTRFVVTPHALRIAALLIEEPRSLVGIAEVLQIRQQYVFAFFSAARGLGLAGQVKTPAKAVGLTPPPTPRRKRSSVLRKILKRLVGR